MEVDETALTGPQPSGGAMTSTDILEKPDVRDADTEQPPEMFHYVKKNKIVESAVMGTMVQALCGEVFPVTKTPKPGSPVCPACKEIYESLKP
jgi:formylmethanofuran dehydrogenase subunit E